jgi:hypothetical protein
MTNSPFANPEDLHDFYEDLVRKLRNRGVVCGITNELACVHYHLARKHGVPPERSAFRLLEPDGSNRD